MTTYTREQAITRNTAMLKKAEARTALKCNGSVSQMASIFEGLILADNKNNKRCGDQPIHN
ncbi:hypothetical protein BCT62_25310 [Vibrio splendidus]|nr:hypothetical protein BCT62_25310 [Vibrio splendidus]